MGYYTAQFRKGFNIHKTN